MPDCSNLLYPTVVQYYNLLYSLTPEQYCLKFFCNYLIDILLKLQVRNILHCRVFRIVKLL